MFDYKLSLEQFRDLKISKQELKKILENLKNKKYKKTVSVCAKDLIYLLESFKKDLINESDILDWVNTIWFSELYEYNNIENDSIASVMNELEEIDEDRNKISDENIEKYIKALKENVELK